MADKQLQKAGELQERLTTGIAYRISGMTRGRFLTRFAVVGAALAINPIRYLLTPQDAFAANCNDGCNGSCGDGYSTFCCFINADGSNNCPSGTSIGGWWYACISSTYCSIGKRYYIDCVNNCSCCGCAKGNCANRAQCCNQGYSNCGVSGLVHCRIVRCQNPKCIGGIFSNCSKTATADFNTCCHSSTCVSAPSCTCQSNHSCTPPGTEC
jgi:hypothetical protein